jgi:hypothetical protein
MAVRPDAVNGVNGVNAPTSRIARAIVLDGRTGPAARAALGGLLARSNTAEIAVGRVRLAAIDFRDSDLACLEHCRVILGQLDINALVDAVESAARSPAAAANVAVLQRFIATGRLELRSGGASRWRPDFCVLRGDDLGRFSRERQLALVGHLGIGTAADRGPNLTCVLAGEEACRIAAGAFERLWADAHDVLDVVAETLDRFARR